MIINRKFKINNIRAIIKNLFYLTIAVMIPASAFISCSSEIAILPMDVGLNKSSATLSPGESLTLTANIFPEEAVFTSLAWSSSNPEVAMVDDGVITAIAEGEATISVSINTKLGQKKRSCQVTVTYPVRSITIDKNIGFLFAGESLILTAIVLPEDAPDKSVTWSSNNPEVATVADGVVIAQRPGTAIITVTTKVGIRVASCRIKVFAENYMVMTSRYSQSTSFLLSGHGQVEIDWGDGSENEVYNLSSAVVDSISHNYSEISLNTITIEGEGVEYLNCSNNQLTSLDVSKNTSLTTLNCSNNPLLNLDLKNNDKLTTLYCINNQLTRLSVNNNVALKNLNCSYNELTNLDLTGNTELINLECLSNKLTGLNINMNTMLENLNCSYNQLNNLDINNNAALIGLDCSNNQLTNLNISKNTALKDFYCDNNRISNLIISNTRITSFILINSVFLENLTVSNNVALRELNCLGNQITDLIVTNNYELSQFNCSYNKINNLDVSTNPMLTYLYCHNNQLTSLDLSNNRWLFLLDCSDNPLTILDVSNNANLSYLHCSKNQLTVLDLSNNILLTHLNCQRNQLTSLNVSNNTVLVFIQCQSNQLSYEALLAFFETLQNKSTNFFKPLCIYGNPGTSGMSYALMDAISNSTRWTIYLPDMNSAMLNPWQLRQ